MATELWVPQPGPSIWDKLKCWIAIHDYETPTEETNFTGELRCKNKCGSLIVWEQGYPIHGDAKLFGKSNKFKVVTIYREKK